MAYTVIDGGITSPKGYRATGIHCGIKKQNLDLAIIASDVPAKCAIAYTQNRMRAAPIEVMMEKDPKMLQAIVINSGNANAITGAKGIYDARDMCAIAAEALHINESLVGVASTGVIARFLPMPKVAAGIPKAVAQLSRGREADLLAARAIMTTDTKHKEAACQVTLKDGTVVTIGGITKGSGMIAPSMKVAHATTLSFITTDAVLNKNANGKWQDIMDNSFNVISVDGDQSTNDVSMFLANGMAGGAPADNDLSFWEGVKYVAQSLAKQVVIDGEGATKLIEVRVLDAKTSKEARSAARAIISSNLVKTAIFGADPNFGRILAALGNSGAAFQLDQVKLDISDDSTTVTLFEKGSPTMVPGSQSELDARKILSGKKIIIDLYLGVGHSFGEAWGCDLTYDYIKINADYTT
ncbi:MAG: bifunctional ornithine acetyltransferase/N-acetylglutamate synthase [Methanomassiliicoccales archaeon]|nr:MAG: bifunctional ornithine acetyltransferase/N-acetylglutamate synthase [Methanomassiliicoccales archaeon]